MASCEKCGDTGVIDTGNNDLPCDCPAGDKASFNVAGQEGPLSGAQVKRHHLNGSPEPIGPGKAVPIKPAPTAKKRPGRL